MIENFPLVSIIVPVYNVENYVSACIESVLSQSYSFWELLLINDGSSDGSGQICDEFQGNESRIKVFHKDNAGVSCARNLGLDVSTGKYVIFLDADDYWSDNTFLESFVSIAEKHNLDMVRGEYKAVDPYGNDLWFSDIPKTKEKIANEVVNSECFIKSAIGREFFLVLSLFKKDSIGALRLNPGQIFLEDMRFYAMLFTQSLKCMYVPCTFYAYRKNITSASNIINYKKLSDSFEMCDFFHTYANITKSLELSQYYNFYSVMMYRWTLETLSLDGYYEQRAKLIDDLKLKNLQERVCAWIKAEGIAVNALCFYVDPMLGVIGFRVINRMRRVLHEIKNYFKVVYGIFSCD